MLHKWSFTHSCVLNSFALVVESLDYQTKEHSRITSATVMEQRRCKLGSWGRHIKYANNIFIADPCNNQRLALLMTSRTRVAFGVLIVVVFISEANCIVIFLN